MNPFIVSRALFVAVVTLLSVSLVACTPDASDDDSAQVTPSPTPSPTPPPPLEGRSYAVDLRSGNIVEPPGAAQVMGSAMDRPMMLRVMTERAPGTTYARELDFLMGTGLPLTTDQDFCEATTLLPAADFSNASDWTVPPTDLTIPLSGTQIRFYNTTLSGTFSANLNAMNAVKLEGWMDTRGVDPLVGGGEGAACALLGDFGIICQGCPNDPNLVFCLHTRIENMTGLWLPENDLIGVNVDQTENHLCPDVCTDGTDNDLDTVVDGAEPECDPLTWP